MYRNNYNGQISIEDFHVPFGGTLDPDNRWVLFYSLMPWEELEETYAPQFNPTTGAPAKPVRLALGALFIKQRLGLTDEETVEQIRENAYMQFFLGFSGYSSKAQFDPSMMVNFRKRFSEELALPVERILVIRGSSDRTTCPLLLLAAINQLSTRLTSQNAYAEDLEPIYACEMLSVLVTIIFASLSLAASAMRIMGIISSQSVAMNWRHDLGFLSRNKTTRVQEPKRPLDDSLEICREKGIEQRKQFSGKLNPRNPHDLDEKLAMAAQAQGKVSINLHRKRSRKVSLRRHLLTNPSSGQATTIPKLATLEPLPSTQGQR